MVVVEICAAVIVVCSQLVCMHFGSWDNAKEWTMSMPAGEDIQVQSSSVFSVSYTSPVFSY